MKTGKKRAEFCALMAEGFPEAQQRLQGIVDDRELLAVTEGDAAFAFWLAFQFGLATFPTTEMLDKIQKINEGFIEKYKEDLKNAEEEI
jgi:hypothetical protein